MQPNHEDRRQDYRLASGAAVEAVVVDQADRPITLLREPQVLNISAGGLAMITDTEVPMGADIRIIVKQPRTITPDNASFVARVLHTRRSADGTQQLNCQLTRGRVPASLIYKW